MHLRRMILMASALAALPVCAQAQDVLMRRPLPCTGSTCKGSISNPSTGTPTPTPPDGGWGGTDPTPDTPLPVNGTDIYRWQTSDWSGTAVCGQPSATSRTVTCERGTLDSGTGNFSWSTVDNGYCLTAVPPEPAASYAGSQAGCPVVVVPQYGAWTTQDGSNASCSQTATRTVTYVCTMNGQTVDDRFCTSPPDNSAPPADADKLGSPQVESGNSASCAPSWVDETTDLGCRAPGAYANAAATGPDHVVQHELVCEKGPDEVDPSQCDASQKPAGDGSFERVGACYKHYGPSQGDNTGHGGPVCMGTKIASEELPSNKMEFYNGSGSAENTFCVQNNAGCCESRQRITNGPDNGTTEVVARQGTADPSVHNDQPRNDDNSVHTGTGVYPWYSILQENAVIGWTTYP